MKTFYKIVAVVAIVCTKTTLAFGIQNFDQRVVDKAKKAVVIVQNNVSEQAYGIVNEKIEGVGCIVDKAHGIVVTNRHTICHMSIGSYKVTFHNGQDADAKLLYYDPWIDYAFLKIDPKDMPADITELEFTEPLPKLAQQLLIVGNSIENQFQITTGNISDPHCIRGSMPQQVVVLNLDSKGALSGSPVLNTEGKAISLVCFSMDNLAYGLHPYYIKYAIEAIKQGKKPVRKNMGAITKVYELNKGVEYRKFPKDKVVEYKKQFPDCMANAIQVERTLPGSLAQSKLLAGDIIWAVNGALVGPDLINLDMAMNKTDKPSIQLTVCRNGEWLNIDVPLYNLEDNIIKRMVSFGGALFFETDDIFSDKSGIAAHKVTFSNAQASTTFNNVIGFKSDNTKHFALTLITLDNVAITSLDKLIELVPKLIAKKCFTIDYINLIPASNSRNEYFNSVVSQRDHTKSDVKYDENSPEPKVYTFNEKTLEWESAPIVLAK